MSNDTSCTPEIEPGAGADSAAARAIAAKRPVWLLSLVAVSLGLLVALAAVSAMRAWDFAPEDIRLATEQDPRADPFAGAPADAFAGPKESAAQRLGRLLRKQAERMIAAAAEARRLHQESMLTKAFADLNQSSPRELRRFLAAYGDNRYAQELGYVAAAERAAAEGRLDLSQEIVDCGTCWCWREKPVPADFAPPTQ